MLRSLKKPTLLFEIDGVINCIGDLGRSLVSFEDEFSTEAGSQVHVPVGARKALTTLGSRFACMWVDERGGRPHSEVGARLGLEEPWPSVAMASRTPSRLASVTGRFGGQAVAWIAGDFGVEEQHWCARRNQDGVPTLLVQTRSDHGISTSDLAELLDWADAVHPPVEIASTAPPPGDALSNFSRHRFAFRGIAMASMEGLLQGLKWEDPERQRRVFGLSGREAKKAGDPSWRETRTLYWQGVPMDREGPGYQALLDDVYRALHEQSHRFRAALELTGERPLRHSSGSNDPTKTVLTRDEFVGRLYHLRNSQISFPPLADDTP